MGNFGEELSLVTQAQAEKMRLAEEKKKQAQARASAALSTPKPPKFTPSQSSRPSLLATSSLNKGLHPLQMKGSKRPVLKTDVHKEKLGNFGSHLTPRSNKSAPEALARTPSKSPSLSDFRKDLKLKSTQRNAKPTFDLDSSSSSDDKETGHHSTPRAALTTPRKEKRQSAPTTPPNSRKQQSHASVMRAGPRLYLDQGKNQDQQSTVTSSSMVVGMSDSAMDTSS